MHTSDGHLSSSTVPGWYYVVVSCAAFQEKPSTSGGSWNTAEVQVLAALSSVAHINCPWCCRLLACFSLSSDSRSVACISPSNEGFSYWYQNLCARYLSLPALVYILISGSLCQVSLTSSVGLYIGIRIFVPDISHFQRWSIYWYQDLCARYLSLPVLAIYWYQDLCASYLSLPALVYILVCAGFVLLMVR